MVLNKNLVSGLIGNTAISELIIFFPVWLFLLQNSSSILHGYIMGSTIMKTVLHIRQGPPNNRLSPNNPCHNIYSNPLGENIPRSIVMNYRKSANVLFVFRGENNDFALEGLLLVILSSILISYIIIGDSKLWFLCKSIPYLTGRQLHA